MKIALICTEKLTVPPVKGGAIQIYIEGILPELSKHHEITVFCIKNELLPDEEEINGVKYIRVEGSNKTEYVKNIEQKLDDSYNLIHVFNRPRWVVTLSRKFPNTKFSLSLHNEMIHEEKIPKDIGLECIKRVEFITTVSKFIADGLLKLFPEANGKIYTVYSGVDVDKYKSVLSPEGIQNKDTLKKKFGIEGKKVVLFVGRLSEKKGADKLITAMKSVMESHPDVALVIVGSKWYGANTTDDYTKSVEALAKSLSGPVIFTGYLPYEVIPAYYNLGDIFVCPSQWNEPLARVHYEAMAAGLPIITTNRGGNKEIIEGYANGIVIDDFSNPDAFSEQISSLLDNPANALIMGIIGRRLAEEKYNWNRVTNDLLTLFKMAEQSEHVLYQQHVENTLKESEESKQVLSSQPSEDLAEENDESKQILPAQPSEVSAEENEESKQILPAQPSEASAEENEESNQVLAQPSEIAEEEAKVSKQILPKQPSKISKKETKVSKQILPKQPSKISLEETIVSKQVLPKKPSKISLEETIVSKQVLPKQPSKISIEENEASKQIPYEQLSEIIIQKNKALNQALNKKTPETTAREKLEFFHKLIRGRYPGMPDEVVEFLEETIFLRGEL